MDIEHLDFDTPDTADVGFDEHGMPLIIGSGETLYHSVIGAMNEQSDQEGWDQPARVYLLTSPLSVQSTLGDVSKQMNELAVDAGIRDTHSPEASVLGVGITVAGDLDTRGGGELWGQNVPEQYGAVLLRSEAYLPWEVLDIERPQRVKERTREDDRAEVRMWMLVTRSGGVFTQMFVRKGRHKSALYDDPTFILDGVVLSVLARSIGVLHPPLANGQPMSAVENMSLRLMWPLLNMMRENNDQSKWDMQTAYDLFSMSDPWVQWSAEETANINTALAKQDPEVMVQWVQQARPMLIDAYARTEQPTWVESMWRGTRDSRFFPEVFPASAEHAEWAGEELLAMLAGQEVDPLRHEVADLWVSASKEHRAYVRAFLTSVNLPLVM